MEKKMPISTDRFETWADDERKIKKLEGQKKTDITPWEVKAIPENLAELPRGYGIRAHEFGWSTGCDRYIEMLVNGTSDEQEDAKKELEYGLLAFINLMRLDSGLDISLDDIQFWDDEEKHSPHWGNEYVPSRVLKTVSPAPAWWYRMVEANWPAVAKRLVFWDPEGDPDIGSGKVDQIEEHSVKRERALTMLQKLRALYDKAAKEADKKAPATRKQRLKRGEKPSLTVTEK